MKSWAGQNAVRLAAVLLLAASLLCPSRSPAQPASRNATAKVSVGGEVPSPYVLNASEVAALPHRSVSVTDEKNRPAVYQGVAVVELLRRAGAPLGSQLRGPKMRLYVLVKGRDGYAAVFALPEFDPAFTDRIILLADRRDGHALESFEGPFRIIVPGEKRHARWVRQVTEIDVMSAK
jgi:Oxidoreductase molybdopterin binding domain